MRVYAPISYWRATTAEKREVCNGCGAKGGIKVPDTMWMLNISLACNIHDWMYKFGVNYADKLFADAIFLLNLSIIILANSNWLTKVPRLMRATKYFIAVANNGTDAYWKDKEFSPNMTITFIGEFRNA